VHEVSPYFDVKECLENLYHSFYEKDKRIIVKLLNGKTSPNPQLIYTIGVGQTIVKDVILRYE
jgi:hypothetical protein